jgi:hypothetical protein
MTSFMIRFFYVYPIGHLQPFEKFISSRLNAVCIPKYVRANFFLP